VVPGADPFDVHAYRDALPVAAKAAQTFSSYGARIVSIAKSKGLVIAPTTYVQAGITPPPADPTGTVKVQPDAPGSSLDPVQ